MVRLRAYRPKWLALSLIAAALAGIAARRACRSPAPTRYRRPCTSMRKPAPAAPSVSSPTPITWRPCWWSRSRSSRPSSPRRGARACSAIRRSSRSRPASRIVVMVGVALNGSLAGYGLALPVHCGERADHSSAQQPLAPVGDRPGGAARTRCGRSARDDADRKRQARRACGELGPIARRHLLDHARTQRPISCRSARASARSAASIICTSGPTQVTTEYVVHAHNDYAELALELGFAGVVLMLLFLAWWGAAVWRAWRTAEAGPFARAAAIASAAVLVHSLVDFPLRTAAISACFGDVPRAARRQPSGAAHGKEAAEAKAPRRVQMRLVSPAGFEPATY